MREGGSGSWIVDTSKDGKDSEKSVDKEWIRGLPDWKVLVNVLIIVVLLRNLYVLAIRKCDPREQLAWE